ncbi:sensor domain-containing diguanylate cyclase [Desulfovibrio ferrophilus]|uniref:Diguanylate cyclase/phosphodiesterase with PAS/PAC sensor n=1 Tax=Desulfovibrio ferrophilus TaxID=241368 RepID=A0A2Z6AUZ2_9BACT|nr:sensor domain-containing diguanylate cyclase [Desulfovibrio ferrophilus]BBD07038.1 diguanylate cyclase/phosphodiesterase with PAS/PAC sensor [Desulfovibrio ferrophilus]
MHGSLGCIDYALLLTAVSLFWLATVCFTADGPTGRRFPLVWLAWFGLLSGIASCLELWGVAVPESDFLMTVRTLVVLGAAICLVEFWARYRERNHKPRRGALGYFALLGVYGFAVALDPSNPFRWTSVFFNALSAMLAAWTFLYAGLRAENSRYWLLGAAVACLGAGGLASIEAYGFTMRAAIDALALFGGAASLGAVLIVRACLVVALTGCIWRMSTPRQGHFSVPGLLGLLWLPVALGLLLLAGWGMTEAEGRKADQAQRRDLLMHSRMVSAALDREMVSWLGWTASDAGKVVYLNLRRRLSQVVDSDGSVSWAMLYLVQDGMMISGAASMLPGPRLPLPPGAVVDKSPDPSILEFWETGAPFVEGPIRRGGTISVTAHVPVTFSQNGGVQAALAMNTEAVNWYRRIAASRLVPIRTTLLAASLLLGFLGTLRLRSRQDTLLQASERRYRSLFGSMLEGVAYCRIIEDEDGKPVDYVFLDMNPAAETMLGKNREVLIGRTALETYPEYNDELQKWVDYFGTVAKTGRTRSTEMFYGPRERWFMVRGFSWKTGSFAISFNDITEQRKTEREHRRLALLDPLTELPNRRLFRDRLDQALARSDRTGQKCAVLYLDLNDFKAVNDNHGHAFGDVVLSEVGDRLRTCMRRSDTLARIGGDEFVAVIPEIKDFTEVAVVAGKIKHSMSRPFRFGDRVAMVGVSIGVSIYPDHGADAGTILLRADAAMYSGKGDKSRQFVMYEA